MLSPYHERVEHSTLKPSTRYALAGLQFALLSCVLAAHDTFNNLFDHRSQHHREKDIKSADNKLSQYVGKQLAMFTKFGSLMSLANKNKT